MTVPDFNGYIPAISFRSELFPEPLLPIKAIFLPHNKKN
ncbi:hypothetical protein RAMDARK_1847 [Rickettsia amblyommatis str. Darkwater]|nr:hypothetical protein RAMDARK_1847 [Rickettsia amblyommatis str. Darkwater]